MLALLLKRRAHVRTFIGLAVATLLCFLASAALLIVKTVTVNNRYSVLTGAADSTPYESRKAMYIEAIKLCPQRSAAYDKLLDAYEKNGRFDMEESAEFTSLYNKAKDLWSEDGGGELAYHAGRMYLALYTENGEPVSMSSRVQRAASYFAGSVNNPPEDVGTAKVASCYNAICQYYSKYILASSNKLELSDADVAALFQNAREALAAIQDGSEYDTLNLAAAICNLLFDQRSEFARVAPGRGEETVILLRMAIQAADQTEVSKPELTAAREQILKNQDEFIAAVSHAFSID